MSFLLLDNVSKIRLQTPPWACGCLGIGGALDIAAPGSCTASAALPTRTHYANSSPRNQPTICGCNRPLRSKKRRRTDKERERHRGKNVPFRSVACFCLCSITFFLNLSMAASRAGLLTPSIADMMSCAALLCALSRCEAPLHDALALWGVFLRANRVLGSYRRGTFGSLLPRLRVSVGQMVGQQFFVCAGLAKIKTKTVKANQLKYHTSLWLAFDGLNC